MKKAIKIACLLLAGLMILLSVSCKRREDPPGDDTETAAPVGSYAEESTPGVGDRHVVSGSKFRIVYGGEADQDSINAAAITLYNLIYEKLGRRMDMRADWSGSEQEFEILIGDTNREGNVSTEGMTYYDYGWTFDGKKVRIFGGSEEAQQNAVKRFAEKYFDEANQGFVVAAGEYFRATYSYPYSSISLGGTNVKDYVVAGKFGYEEQAKAVAAGFGRLCGARLAIDFGKDGAAQPSGRYIYVGYGETGDRSMTYTLSDGILRFIGNGGSGSFNQLERAVEAFFEKNFQNTDQKDIDLRELAGEKIMPQLANMQFAEADFINSLNTRFEENRQAILNAESDYQVTGDGQIYYVSSSEGNDDNDGLAPDRAWATLTKVNGANVPAGSVILFRRGDVWNRQGRLYSKSNVTFSAYGEGEKPLFSCYLDASLPSDWTEVGENLYVYSGNYESSIPYHNGVYLTDRYPKRADLPGSYLTSTDEVDGDDVGNIIFNDDEGWGVKIMKKNNSSFSVGLGTVPTGFGTLTHSAVEFEDQKDLKQHLEFYHNPQESRLYLYCEGGNPGEVFRNIKLVLMEYLFYGNAEDCTNVRLDNLAFKYVGCHGISIIEARNFTIQNCEIGWCGGSIQGYTWGNRDEPTRFGEGIQNWGNCDGFRILNNYIHQIYDGATSSQQSTWEFLPQCIMQNIEVTGNYYENNTACIEFWLNLTPKQGDNEKFMFKNWNISDNMMRRSGYGFGGTRPSEASGGAMHFTDSHGWPKPIYQNVLFAENFSWDSTGGIVSGLGWGTEMYHLKDNVFIHAYGDILGALAGDFNAIADGQTRVYYYDAETLEMLEEKKVFGQNQYYYTYKNETEHTQKR